MKQRGELTISVASERDFDFVFEKAIKNRHGNWQNGFLFTFSLLKRPNISFYLVALSVFLLFLGFPLPVVFGCVTGM